MKSSDPDKALRNLDSDAQARFLLLRSSKAEILYARYFLNIDLSPYQVFIVKLLRGVYKTEAQARQDIEDLGIQWVYDTGRVRFAADEKGILYPNNEIMLPGGFGKALALDTPLPTPDGWTTMGEVRAGDDLLDEQGRICHVTYKSPVWLGRKCYEVTSNGSAPIVADEDHLWMLSTDRRSQPHIHNTRYIAKRRLKASVSVPTTRPLQLPDRLLPIPPYTLGAWLGDGDSSGGRMSQGAEDKQFVRDQIEADGYTTTDHTAAINFGVLGLSADLRKAGLIGNKHIPGEYLRASAEQRLSLLQGLIDTDGHVGKNHAVEFSSTNKRLALGVAELVRTLGAKASLYEDRATICGRDCGPRYRVYFMLNNAARLPRKAERCGLQRNGKADHSLKAVPVGTRPTACIQVDSPSHLFLAGEAMIPTHNTTLLQLVLDMEAHDNPNCRNQLVFKNITEAHSMADAVRQDLQNSKAVELFGDPVPKDGTWSNERFNVAWRQWGDIRANFEFFSLGGDYVGKRCDKGYSDDCETDKTARTTDACESMIASFNNGPFTHPKPIWVKDKQGRVQIPKKLDWPDRLYWGWSNLGTIFHPRGLHARCENDPTFNTVVFDCFRDSRQTQSLDDRMMTAEELHAKRRSLGVLSFNKRYRNLAVDPAEMHFHEESLRGGDVIAESGERVHYDGCLDREYSYGEYADDWTLYMGFDPATGSKTRFAAFSAYVVIGVPNHDPQVEPECFLVDYLKIQTDYSRQLDYLLDGNPQLGIEGFMNKYTFRRITLEKNNHGMMAVGDDRVKPYITNGLIQPSYTGVQKLDPLVGVPAMAPMVENGKFHLPYKTGTDQERSETFIVDMVEFHPIRDKRDLVMALWLATIPIREGRKQPQTWHSGRVYRSPFMRAGARNRP